MWYLSDMGVKTTYTAAAHDKNESEAEHKAQGMAFNYPHLTDPIKWQLYLAGYKSADLLIVPSQHSMKVMTDYGCTNKMKGIPHGVHYPEKTYPEPDRFTVGYLGSLGPDKGFIYLLEAWGKWSRNKDCSLWVGGRDSHHYRIMYKKEYPNVHTAGWLHDVNEFYRNISVYVQPSVTEGFGIEVLEAQAYGRVTLCSEGAGAVDCVPRSWTFPARNVDELICLLEEAYLDKDRTAKGAIQRADIRDSYTWDKIKSRYVQVWQELLAGRK